jgi:hypothetical protein
MRRLTDRLAKLEASRSDVTSRSRILFGRDDADLLAQREAMVASGRAAESDTFIMVTWAGTLGSLMTHIADNGRKLHRIS